MGGHDESVFAQAAGRVAIDADKTLIGTLAAPLRLVTVVAMAGREPAISME